MYKKLYEKFEFDFFLQKVESKFLKNLIYSKNFKHNRIKIKLIKENSMLITPTCNTLFDIGPDELRADGGGVRPKIEKFSFPV